MRIKYLTIFALPLFLFCKNSSNKQYTMPNVNNLTYRFIQGDSTDVANYFNLENKLLFSIRYYKSGQIKDHCVYFDEDTIVELDTVTLEEKETVVSTIDCRDYYKNGKTKYISSYEKGKKTGIWMYFDTMGNHIKTENYNNDTLVYSKIYKD
jgi:antitoxin component YwqK of YwqJK toxin-antitoxin module